MSSKRGTVIRQVHWQAVLALVGIALVFAILYQFASTQTPTVGVEVPIVGGTYTEGVLGYSETLNPILAPLMIQANPVDQDLNALVFDGLTTLDATGHVSPALAVDWDVSEDGTVYEFQLRRDVFWHDGAPFTAADVAFTIQAMQDPGYQGNQALQELWRGVTVDRLSDYVIRFTLAEPFPSFIYYTTNGLLPAHLLSSVPAAELSASSFSTRKPIGTGMFSVESLSPERAVLAANPNYWGPKPYLEQIEVSFFGDWDGLVAAYERGEIDAFQVLHPRDMALLARFPNLQLYSAQWARYGMAYLNLRRETLPFFQEKEVRQALLYALDRQALIDQVLKGQGLIADSPILPRTWAYDPSVRRYLYDPERAIGLADASGWVDSDGDRVRDKDGVALAFELLVSDDPSMVEMAEEIARQWTAVGVNARVRSAKGQVVTDFVRQRNFEAVLVEVGLAADPDPYPLWHSAQAEELGQNFSGFANDAADVVMEEARSTVDVERQAELYRAFQQIFVEEVPSLLLYYPTYTYAVDARVRGVQLSPMLYTSDRFRNVRDWYVETQEIRVSEEEVLDKTRDS